MKVIRYLVIFGMASLLFSGCVQKTFSEKPFSEKIKSLQKGMTCEEVEKILGSPDYAEIGGPYLVWSYHTYDPKTHLEYEEEICFENVDGTWRFSMALTFRK